MAITLKQAIAQAQLQLVDSDSPKLDAELLLLATLNKPDKAYLMTWPDKTLSTEEQYTYDNLIERRKNGEPVAYILQQREFWSLPLEVSPDTLIPRPDTETLVAAVLDKIHNQAIATSSLLDLGSGTGAIALALKSELPNWSIVATDFNPRITELILRNADKNNLTVDVYLGSWYQALPLSHAKFKIIVSNPPYIEDADPHLSQGDVRFEPRTALSSGADGLDDIRIIIQQSQDWLLPEGWLFLEHGYNQASAVSMLFTQFNFKNVTTLQDLNGQDRVTLAQY